MSKLIEESRLLSHKASFVTLESIVNKTTERIKQKGDAPYVTVQRQLELLAQMTTFDFGRHLLQNQGVNGYWTHYMLTHPWYGRKTGKNNRGEPLSELEDFILNRAPILLATQERFEIFLKENQKKVMNKAKLACVPCGMMGELLYLDYSAIEKAYLIGIDYDPEVLDQAAAFAKKQGLAGFTRFSQKDAWQLGLENEFDLVSSNGLNIYEPDSKKVSELYRQFYRALKRDGKLVTSFLTYPPMLTEDCEWALEKLNQKDLLLQKIIFTDLIEARCQCYSSSEETLAQLKSAGFEDIQLIYDEAKIFPTVVAYKRGG